VRRRLFRWQRRWDRLLGTTLACLFRHHSDCQLGRTFQCLCDCHFQF